MNMIKDHFRRNKLLYPLIGCMLFITSFSLTVVTFFISHSSEQALLDEIVSSRKTELECIASIVDSQEEYANYLMQNAMQDSDISMLFNARDEAAATPGLRAMEELRQSVKQLCSVYIYNQDSRQIYITNAAQTYAMTDLDQFVDPGFLQILENIESYPESKPILRLAVQEHPDGQRFEEDVYTYLLYDTDKSGAVRNIMAFNFHRDWMGEALHDMTPNNGGVSMCIVDRNREIVYADQDFPVGAMSGENQFLDSIFDQPSGYRIIDSEESAKDILVWSSSDRAGDEQWTFVSNSNYSEVLMPIIKLCRIVYIISALMLLGSIAFLFRSIRRSVKNAGDDVETIKQEYAKKRAIEKEIYLHNLFLGALKEESSKIKGKLKELGFNYPIDQDNRVMLIAVDYYRSFLLRFHDRIEETELEIENILQEILRQNYGEIIMLKMQKAWCVCVPAEQNIRTVRLKGVFDQINQKLMERLDITVSIAVSSLGHSAGDVPYLYAEAVKNLSYRFLLGNSQILTPDIIKDYGSEKFCYPHETEEKLISSLQAGRQEEAVKLYDLFVDQTRLFSMDEIRLSFVLLANAIKRSFDNTIAEISSVLVEFDQFHRRLDELETLEEVNQMFLHLIWEITEKIQEHSLKKYKQIIAQVKEYVAENYSQITLSMNEVANYVGMSSAYLGRLFRQLTDTTFSDYLTKIRLDAACDLILSTNKTIAEISALVGFTNCSYFYIVFKKYLNCTPAQYRKQKTTAAQENDDTEEMTEEKN